MAKRGGLRERIRSLQSCEECAPNQGLWRVTENESLERCWCLRGKLLRVLDQVQAKRQERAREV